MTMSIGKTKGAKAFEDVAAQTKQSFEGFLKSGHEQTQKQFEQASAQMMKGYEDLTALSKENIDALVQSGTVAIRGAEALGKEVAAYTQASFEKSVAAGKAMMGAKSLREVVDLQNDYAKANFDALVAESTKLSEMSVKLTTEAFAPVAARFNATVGKITKPLAA